MSSAKKIVIYGAGGLARETEGLIQRINAQNPVWDVLGYVVSDPSSLGEYDSKDRVIGDEPWLVEQPDVFVTIGIGSPKVRQTIGTRLRAKLGDDRLPVLIDPSAIFDGQSCQFEPGVIITAGCILTVNIHVDTFAFINLDCTIGHEARIGPGVVLNPSVNISGGVNIGAGTLVGTGAQVLQYLELGEGATIGAGSLVTKNVAAGATVVGVPAKART